MIVFRRTHRRSSLSQCSIGFCCQGLCMLNSVSGCHNLVVESGPKLDPAQDTHLQRTVAILETTRLQTNLSHQVQESTGPAQHTTRRHHQDRKTKSLPPRLHHPRCCERSVQQTTRFQFRQDEPCDSFSKALASPVTTASYSVSLLVPASTICRSCPE